VSKKLIPVALSKHKTVVEVNEDNLEGPQHTEEQSMQHGKHLLKDLYRIS